MEDRHKILKYFCFKFNLNEDVIAVLNRSLCELEGESSLSGADIESMCKEAAMETLHARIDSLHS
jgi:SpoVK/Ycf46/Vps4 family AAA+-type ATPase